MIQNPFINSSKLLPILGFSTQKNGKKKVDKWKKKIDCDYDWGCEICPYREECYNIKQVLVERERIGN